MKINKKGFTLVELLAIIVVLAIIAAVAVPTIINTIRNSKIGVDERSVENYIKAIETTVVAEQTRGNEMEDIYLIKEDGNLCPKSEGLQCKYPIEIKATGTKPTSGTIVLENGKVLSSSDGKIVKVSQYYSQTYRTIITIDDTKVFYEDERATTNFLCYKTTEGDIAKKVSINCNFGEDWESFVILNMENENVTLLMNSNLGEVKSIQREDAEKTLKDLTKNWTKLDDEQIIFPSAYDLAYASGLTDWQEGDLDKRLDGWLTSGLAYDDSGWRGYWTSTPSPETNLYPAFNYYIYRDAKIAHADNYAINIGVRPIVTITKDMILY